MFTTWLPYCSIQFWGWNFLQRKSHYHMNQNFKDTEKEKKVAVLVGKQAAITLVTCALLMKKLCTPIWNVLHIQKQKYIQNCIVLLQKNNDISETIWYGMYGIITGYLVQYFMKQLDIIIKLFKGIFYEAIGYNY